eukprot:TRINITY_DN687_c0_g1_i1.p1 TRINITY_DN687_c0_g1~~TRINITY_DN687_c0_g1_i1.p1  ORF type:complete len:601 (+),score=172.61 TRINITY_DN687_c0_g1_i1:144-1946(+)
MGDVQKEVADCAQKVCKVFTVQYTKAYTLALVRLIKEEKNKKPKPDYHLTTRPTWDKEYKSGYLVKEGGKTKNWKKRWFVVRPNWTCDYYVDEATANSGPKAKKKGSINFCGYWVNTDPNDSTIGRLRKLADRMGIDFSSLPLPKPYPPLTLELYHSRRRCYYITAANKEEFDDWVAQFRNCCWYARGLTIDEECHRRAFPVAARKTRWELGRWSWWSNSGSEEQILAEMIADELDYDIMGKVYGKLVGPWVIRNMLRTKAQKVVDSAVMAVVKPAWSAMYKGVEALRPKIEPKIRDMVEPIFDAEKNVMDKIKDGVNGVIRPIQEEHVNPYLARIVDIVRKPMAEGFAEAFKIWEKKITEYDNKGKGDLQASFSELDWFPRSYWEMRDATNKAEGMYDGLRDLQVIFTDLWPWSLCWHATSAIRKTTDNAVYTWEQCLVKAGDGAGSDKAQQEKFKQETLAKFKHDADLATHKFSAKVMKLILLPPFEALLHPAAKHIIEPIASAIPDALQEFIDIKQNFEDLYNGILDDAITSVVNHSFGIMPADKSAPAIAASSSSSSSSSTTTTTTHNEGESSKSTESEEPKSDTTTVQAEVTVSS